MRNKFLFQIRHPLVYFVKVRSCLLAGALAAHLGEWRDLRHFGYRRGHTYLGSFGFAPQRLEHPLSVCQEAWYSEIFCLIEIHFFCTFKI